MDPLVEVQSLVVLSAAPRARTDGLPDVAQVGESGESGRAVVKIRPEAERRLRAGFQRRVDKQRERYAAELAHAGQLAAWFGAASGRPGEDRRYQFIAD
jgi:hypothetical protein